MLFGQMYKRVNRNNIACTSAKYDIRQFSSDLLLSLKITLVISHQMIQEVKDQLDHKRNQLHMVLYLKKEEFLSFID